MRVSLVANISGSAQHRVLNGRKYIVVPLTMIVPGVLPGNQGPLLYEAADIAASVDAWNNVPIVLNHPQRNGKFVSGRDPEILEQYGLGTIFNTRFRNKLISEGWFDIEKTRKIAPEVYSAIRNGTPYELSTGLRLKPDDRAGVYNSNGKAQSYVGRATNFRPDHLAVLTGTKGACSLDDGCGVNVNMAFTNNGGPGSGPRKRGGKERDSKFLKLMWPAKDSLGSKTHKATAASQKANKLNTIAAHEAAHKAHLAASIAYGKKGSQSQERYHIEFANKHFDKMQELISSGRTHNNWSPSARSKSALVRAKNKSRVAYKATAKAYRTALESDHLRAVKAHKAAVHAYQGLTGQSILVEDHKTHVKMHGKGGINLIDNAWSDEARQASIEARRKHLHNGFNQWHGSDYPTTASHVDAVSFALSMDPDLSKSFFKGISKPVYGGHYLNDNDLIGVHRRLKEWSGSESPSKEQLAAMHWALSLDPTLHQHLKSHIQNLREDFAASHTENTVSNAWSPQAREAAILARKSHAQGPHIGPGGVGYHNPDDAASDKKYFAKKSREASKEVGQIRAKLRKLMTSKKGGGAGQGSVAQIREHLKGLDDRSKSLETEHKMRVERIAALKARLKHTQNVHNAWSEAARQAAIEARKSHSGGHDHKYFAGQAIKSLQRYNRVAAASLRSSQSAKPKAANPAKEEKHSSNMVRMHAHTARNYLEAAKRTNNPKLHDEYLRQAKTWLNVAKRAKTDHEYKFGNQKPKQVGNELKMITNELGLLVNGGPGSGPKFKGGPKFKVTASQKAFAASNKADTLDDNKTPSGKLARAHLAAGRLHAKAEEYHLRKGNTKEAAFHYRHSNKHHNFGSYHKMVSQAGRTNNEHIGFDKLVGILKGEGHGEESAKAIAATIGRKKYGKKGMAKKSAKGRRTNNAWSEEARLKSAQKRHAGKKATGGVGKVSSIQAMDHAAHASMVIGGTRKKLSTTIVMKVKPPRSKTLNVVSHFHEIEHSKPANAAYKLSEHLRGDSYSHSRKDAYTQVSDPQYRSSKRENYTVSATASNGERHHFKVCAPRMTNNSRRESFDSVRVGHGTGNFEEDIDSVLNFEEETDMSKLSQADRAKLIGNITANCECWKDDADILNKFNDERLKKISAHVTKEKARQEAIDEGLQVGNTRMVLNAENKWVEKPAKKEEPTTNSEGGKVKITMNDLPPELQARIKWADEQMAIIRNEKVEAIKADKTLEFSDDELKTMDDGMLDKLSKAAKARSASITGNAQRDGTVQIPQSRFNANYGGQGAGQGTQVVNETKPAGGQLGAVEYDWSEISKSHKNGKAAASAN